MTIQHALELALQHHRADRLAEAEAIYRQVLAADPRNAVALNLLGCVARRVGRNDVAVDLIRKAVTIQPDFPEAHNNLGDALQGGGQLDAAIAAYRQAIALRPNFPEAHYNLGVALSENGQADDAIASYRTAVALRPGYWEALTNLGNVLTEQGRFDEAVVAHREAIALRPGLAETHANLGNALQLAGRLDEAIAAFRRAIVLKPDYAEAHSNLGNALRLGGELDTAIAAYRNAIALAPHSPIAHSNLLLALNYQSGIEARTVAEEHRGWNRHHAEILRQCVQPHANERSPHRRLRIGYVSPDFFEHPVAFFLENLLASHDPAHFEIFSYSSMRRSDPVNARLRKLVPHWRDIARMTDEKADALIRSDAIDILVDLAGHTAGNRLLVFARKPAPVQVTWLGYPNTTGMTAMDWRLTDALADPPGTTESLHSERLVRLPDCAWCFRPAEDAPPVSAPPFAETGYITFGCFNSMPKINASLPKLWSEILHTVPGSRLLLKNRSLHDAPTRERLRALLGDSGIAKERVELAGDIPKLADHMAAYARVDIALDTFPYHGTTTTCEALWTGVPVVTLAGQAHASRVGVSLLTNVGLPELVAYSGDEYVKIASELAADLPRLALLRATLRGKMERSVLMDAPHFARQIETAYRDMWRAWCGESLHS